jgi:hypothetical protein
MNGVFYAVRTEMLQGGQLEQEFKVHCVLHMQLSHW